MIQDTVRNFASIGAVIIFTLGAGFGQAHAGVVTSALDDSSLGSLRQIIANAASGETITFDPSLNGKTITLTNGQLVLSKNVQIVGPGANRLKISGNNASRVFYVNTGVTASISGLTIANGSGGGPISTGGGAAGGVVLTNSGAITLTGTTAVSGGTLVLNPGTVLPPGSGATVNAVITTGTGGLVKVGTGTLTLCATNTYTGTTAVTGGTLVLNPGTVIPSGNTTMTVNTLLTTNAGTPVNVGSGTLVLTGANTSVGSTVVNGGGVTVNSGTVLSNGTTTTTNAGGFVISGSGGTATNTYTGSTTVSGGTLTLTPGTLGSGTVNALSTTNAGGLATTGSGLTVLAGTNTYTGATTVTGGTLALNSGTISPTNANSVTIVNGTPGTGSGASLTLGGAASPGLANAGAMNFTGATNSLGATLTVGSAAATNVGLIRYTATGALLPATGTLQLIGNPSITATTPGTNTLTIGDLSNSATLNATDALIRNPGFSVQAGSLAVTMVNPSALTLNGSNGFALGTSVNGLNFNGNLSLATIGSLASGNFFGGIIISSAAGAGIYNDAGILTVTDCAISDNKSGGAIYNRSNVSSINGIESVGGSLKLISCTVSGNAGQIGGIATDAFATTVVTNSTIAGNTGTLAGAAFTGFGAQLILHNCTVAGNTASVPYAFPIPTVGGILASNATGFLYSQGKPFGLYTDNTVFSNNSPRNFAPIFAGRPMTSSGYNLSDDASMTSVLTGPGDLNSTPAGLDLDAQGKPRLQDNGGPTPTIALLAGSAAIDKGDPAFAGASLPSDQRGFPRVANGRLDIGAFETQTPRSLTIAVQRALQAIPATTDPTGRALRAALDSLTLSLQPVFWVDDTHLTLWGRWVFNADRFTVEALTRVVNAGGPRAAGVQDWIDYLAEADEVLAKVAIRDATTGDPGKLAEANREFATAEQSLAQNNFRDAIEHFAKAWEYAQKAMRKIPRVPVGS